MTYPVQVIDTGYAIHLQTTGIDKGTALEELAQEMDLTPSDFLAIGDSLNDIQMLKKPVRSNRSQCPSRYKSSCTIYCRKRIWKWIC